MYYHMTYLIIYMAFLSCLTKIVLEVVNSTYHGRIFREILRHDIENNSTFNRNYSINHRIIKNLTNFDFYDDPYESTSMVSVTLL